MTYCAPVERPVHHKGLSIWFAPSAIKTGSVYTWGELSFSLCLSVSLNLSLPCLLHTHTYAHTPLCHNRECLLRRHLPECGLTDISHPAVADDHEEQGQRFLPCPYEPCRAFGSTMISVAIPEQKVQANLAKKKKIFKLTCRVHVIKFTWLHLFSLVTFQPVETHDRATGSVEASTYKVMLY